LPTCGSRVMTSLAGLKAVPRRTLQQRQPFSGLSESCGRLTALFP